MKTFTYILGAGASAQKIPIVKDLGTELVKFHDKIVNLIHLPDKPHETGEEAKNKFLIDLLWLADEIKNHASIDTFARKLYLTNQIQKLKTLKALVDCYFTTIQTTQELDLRYDAFLASILTGDNRRNIQLPDNVRILNWNYDFQFELSLYNFFEPNNIKELEGLCKFIPNSNSDFNLENEFCIIKLNGTVGGFTTHDGQFRRKDITKLRKLFGMNKEFNDRVPDSFEIENKIFIDTLSNYFVQMESENTMSSVLFAWEKDELVKKVRDFAIAKIKDTQILIVIGYSFPTFNRNIDKELLKSMTQLNKIIIQALPKDLTSIEFKINSLIDFNKKIEIQKISSVDEFFIPFEF